MNVDWPKAKKKSKKFETACCGPWAPVSFVHGCPRNSDEPAVLGRVKGEESKKGRG